MATFCQKQIKKAAGDLLSDKDVKELINELKRRAKNDAEKDISDISSRLNDASRNIFDERKRELMVIKRNALINIKKKAQIQGVVFSDDFKDDPVKGLRAYLDGIQSNIKNSRFSTSAVQKSTITKLWSRAYIEMRKEDLTDLFRQKETESDIAREMFEEGSVKDPKIQKLAKIIKNAYAEGVRLLNSEGADIRNLDEYIARQTHDAEKLMYTADTMADRLKIRYNNTIKSGRLYKNSRKDLNDIAFKRWRDFILPRLDQNRTFDGIEDREQFLRGSYDGIITGKHIRPNEDKKFKGVFEFTGPANKAKKLSTERLIHFKNGESWFEYNQKYGSGSVQLSVVQTLRSMGESIGLMKMWGPNPRSMFDSISQEIGLKQRFDPKINKKLLFADHIFSELDGTTRIPVDNLLAKISANTRAVQTLSKLGLVLTSSFPDVAIRASLMRDHGESFLSSYSKSFGALLEGKSLKETQEISDLLGTYTEAEVGSMSAYFASNDTPAGGMTKAMQVFFKYAGMEWWDKTHRTSVGQFLSRNLANKRNLKFNNLDLDQQRILSTYGITSKEWDLVRKNGSKIAANKLFITPDGMRDIPKSDIAKFLDKDVAELSNSEAQGVRDDMEDRLRTYFIDQTDHAIIQPSAADRAYIIRGTQPGTVLGEALRFIGQFKYFSIAFVRRVIGRKLFGYGADSIYDALIGGKGDILGLAQLMIGTTALGYISLAAKNAVKGLTPPPPNDAKTWFAALSQGGGLGIYGDFLFGQYDRYGNSFLLDLLGPTAGTIDDVATVAAKLRDLDNPAKAVTNVIANNTPFANLWFTRTALNYLFLYGLQEHMSPGYLDRMSNRLKKQNDQEFIFSPQQYALGVS